MQTESTRKCGNCGELGHNKRKCTNPQQLVSPKQESTRKCGNCGELGHTKRKCTNPQQLVSPKQESTRKCGNCGELGHTKRKCTNPCLGADLYCWEQLVSPKQESKRKCGTCGEFGHNKRKCVLKDTSEVIVAQALMEMTQDKYEVIAAQALMDMTQDKYEVIASQGLMEMTQYKSTPNIDLVLEEVKDKRVTSVREQDIVLTSDAHNIKVRLNNLRELVSDGTISLSEETEARKVILSNFN